MDGKRLVFLSVLLIVYILIGAGLFMAAEHWKEKEIRKDLIILYDAFIGNFSCFPNETLLYLIDRLDSAKGQGIRLINPLDNVFQWDFASALCYCIAVVTTIGYGDMVPATVVGKCLTVGYALIGIPLCLIVLGGIGERVSTLSRTISSIRVSRHATLNKVLMTIVLIVIGLGFLFIIPSVVLMKTEDWSFFIGLYYCVITLTTIGFGDYVPGEGTFPPVGWKRDTYKIAFYVWILLGLAYLSLVIQISIHMISRRAEQVRKKAAEKVVDFKKVSVKFTRSRSKADLSAPTIDPDMHGIVNASLSTDYDDDIEGSPYEDLCERCRQLMIEMENSVKLVRVSKRITPEENGEETISNRKNSAANGKGIRRKKTDEVNGDAVIVADEQV